jgi:RHS repeat-associated protein
VRESFAQVGTDWGGSALGEVGIMLDRQNVLWFTNDGAGRLRYNYGRDYVWQSSDDPDDNILIADQQGKRWLFKGKDTEHPHFQGRLLQTVSRDGTTTNLGYESDTGRLLTYSEIRDGVTGEFSYEWDDTRVVSVTLTVDGTDVERALYTYHDGTTDEGPAGCLKSVVRQRPETGGTDWFPIGETYHTYYVTDGPFGALRFLLEPEATARLRAARPDPSTWNDTIFEEFADFHLFYGGDRRVTSEVLRGGAETHDYGFFERSSSSASSSSASSRLSSRSSASSSSAGYPASTNSWQTSTSESTQDGVVKTAYCNANGQVMLLITTGPDDISWFEAYRYDADGQLVLKATSTAVAGYDDTREGKLFTLKPHEGLVYHYRTYVPDPNPNSIWKINRQELSKGEFGTRVLLSEHTFKARQVVADISQYLAQEDIYSKNPESSGVPRTPDTTKYTYVWYDNLLTFQQRITILPAVSARQNGSGTSDTRTEICAPNGQLLWLKDERGFISEFTYDDATGAPVRTVRDYNTAASSSSSGTSSSSSTTVPDGWETPSGGGLNLVTDYEHDDRGRITQELGPPHEIDLGGTATTIRQATWTVYRDDLRQQWIGRGYATGSEGSYTYVLIDPVQLLQMDYTGRMTSQASAQRTTGSGRLQPTDEFDRSSGSLVFWSRWSTSGYDDQSRLVSQRLYHAIPAAGDGASGTNYAETIYGYDVALRRNRVKTPGGTITRTVYLPRGMAKEVWVGTNDTGATDADPTGDGAEGNNMVKVVENVYDDDESDGNGHLTQTTAFAGAEDLRGTTFSYDFRDRRTATSAEIDFYEQYLYDNADRVIQVDRRDGPAEESNLIARNKTAYDAQGRVYKTTRYGVNPANGDVSEHALRERTWYDPAGQVMKQRSQEGGGFEKMQYDGVGRVVTRYVACDPDPEDYEQAGTVAGDFVLEQTEFIYDAASNLIEQHKLERNHDATVTGSLSSSIARLSFAAMYPDALGRTAATADYGTYGGDSWTRPETAPDSSDTCLVSLAVYNNRGELEATTDPLGTVQRQEFDDAGRQIQIIENYRDSGSGPDINKTTLFGYNLDGKLVTLTAQNSVTGDQLTQWVYGTTLSDSGVASFELLRAKIYPDSDDAASPLGNGLDGLYDRVEYRYDRLGELTELKDQNETVHAYEYDKLGRLLHDKVTVVGDGIDDAILRISREYEVRGMLKTVTSADGVDPEDSEVVNQVKLTYNEFGLLIADSQSHNGIEETPPVVSYTYGPAASSGSSSSSSSASGIGSPNSITRPRTIVYPDGRTLTYEYGAEGSVDSLRGRVHEIKDGENTLVRYTYRGIKSTVRIEYIEPGIELTYIMQSGESPGDAGDQYTGLDRFGRIVDVRWLTTGTTNDVDRFQYGFDRAGNRTYRRNVLGSTAGYDELYAYDGLYQLSDLQRGELNPGRTAITGTLAWEETITYDPTGNWPNYVTKVAGSTTLDQTRTHNKANEITATADPSVPLGYDRNGNMLRQGDSSNGNHLAWDAWNRLVEASQSDEVVFARYQYDGLTRRIWKQTFEGGEGLAYRHYYYSNQWQVLEERFGDLSVAERQFVWGRRYADDLILRDSPDPLPEYNRLYSTHDQWHCTALVATTGEVVQRYAYDAFGNPVALSGSFLPNDYFYYWEYRFGAYRWDWETGTYQVRYRQYQPRLGRWLSRDPAEEGAGLNLYSHVHNNTPTSVDPNGLAGFEDHHWFPVLRPGMRGQPAIDAVCGRGFLNIDDYTSSLGGPSRIPGTAHHYVTHTLKYSKAWQAMYNTIIKRVKKQDQCCILLAATATVENAITLLLMTLADPRVSQIASPEFAPGVPHIHPHGKFIDTMPDLIRRIIEACRKCKNDKIADEVAREIFDKLREMMKIINEIPLLPIGPSVRPPNLGPVPEFNPPPEPTMPL